MASLFSWLLLLFLLIFPNLSSGTFINLVTKFINEKWSIIFTTRRHTDISTHAAKQQPPRATLNCSPISRFTIVYLFQVFLRFFLWTLRKSKQINEQGHIKRTVSHRCTKLYEQKWQFTICLVFTLWFFCVRNWDENADCVQYFSQNCLLMYFWLALIDIVVRHRTTYTAIKVNNDDHFDIILSRYAFLCVSFCSFADTFRPYKIILF